MYLIILLVLYIYKILIQYSFSVTGEYYNYVNCPDNCIDATCDTADCDR